MADSRIKRAMDLEKLQARRRADSDGLPRWNVSRKAVPEEKLLSDLVSWRSKVVCIGAFGSIKKDPSLKVLINSVRGKNVSVVDVQDSPRDGTGSLLEKMRQKMSGKSEIPPALLRRYGVLNASRVATEEDLANFGEGGLTSLRKSIKFQKRTFSMRKSGIRLIPAPAWETGIKRKSVDLIVERGSWYYVLGQKMIFPTLNHYLSLLRPGGKLVLYTGIQPHQRVTSKIVGQHDRELKSIISNLVKEKLVSATEMPLDGRNNNGSRRTYSRALVLTKLKSG